MHGEYGGTLINMRAGNLLLLLSVPMIVSPSRFSHLILDYHAYKILHIKYISG